MFDGCKGDYQNKTKNLASSLSELFSHVGAGCVMLNQAVLLSSFVLCDAFFLSFFLSKMK